MIVKTLSLFSACVLIIAISAIVTQSRLVAMTVAPEEGPSNPALTPASRRAALDAIIARLRRAYIYPDLVPPIISRLRSSESRYATADPDLFARRVTEDMQAVTRDTHLYLNLEPDWYRASNARPSAEQVAAENAAAVEHARSFNHGLAEMRILPGNVRYLRIEGFFWIGAESALAYDGAMRFLRDGRAIILDLRSNRGGETEAAYYLLSHFLDPDALMLTIVSPGEGNVEVRARRDLPAGRIRGVPSFVLTNGTSRSAAEAVAYTFRQLRLGEVVGEKTEGAAHISDDTPVPPYFRLSVPVAYTRDPVAQADWEGVGVSPTVAATSSGALDTAYGLALTDLLRSTTDPEQRAFLVWAAQGLAARRDGRLPTQEELSRMAGRYGGASIEFRDQSLWFAREGRAPRKLVPMGSGLFEAEEDTTFRVRILDRALEVLRPIPSMNEHLDRTSS